MSEAVFRPPLRHYVGTTSVSRKVPSEKVVNDNLCINTRPNAAFLPYIAREFPRLGSHGLFIDAHAMAVVFALHRSLLTAYSRSCNRSRMLLNIVKVTWRILCCLDLSQISQSLSRGSTPMLSRTEASLSGMYSGFHLRNFGRPSLAKVRFSLAAAGRKSASGTAA